MSSLVTWPADLPTALDGLYEAVAAQIGAADIVRLDRLTEIAAHLAPEVVGDQVTGAANGRVTDTEPVSLMIVVDAALTTTPLDMHDVLDGLRLVAECSAANWVAVVGDGYLGTDSRDVAPALMAAAAVTSVRSCAARRGWGARANAVCVPDGLFGRAGEQRGPLALRVDTAAIADAVAFLLGPDAGYLSGQILFADGGRHLFSSMSA